MDIFSKSSISTKALLNIILFSGVITALLACFQLWVDFSIEKNRIDMQVESAKAVSLDTITQSLWSMEDKIIKIQLDSLIRMPYIEKATVSENNLLLSFSVGKVKGKFTKESTEPLVFVDPETKKSQVIGVLSLIVSYDQVYSNIFRAILLILFSQGVKTFFVSAFILYTLHRLVLMRINSISAYLEDIDVWRIARPSIELVKTDSDEINKLEIQIDDLKSRLYWYISELKEAKNEIKSQQLLSQGIIDSIHDSIFTVDSYGVVRHSNIAAQQKFFLNEERNVSDIIKIGLLEVDMRVGRKGLDFQSLISLKDDVDLDVFGSWYFDGYTSIYPMRLSIRPTVLPDGSSGRVIIIIDKSEMKEIERINYNATHDLLTGLLNRYKFGEILDDVISDYQRSSNYVLVFVDIDNFKSVNDVFGHHVGDEAIKLIAKCIADCLGKDDVAARFGGDEFNILICGDVLSAKVKMEEVLQGINEFSLDEDRKIPLSASIGITPIYETDTKDTLLIRANDAGHNVKKSGGGSILISYRTNNEKEKNTLKHYQTIQRVKKEIFENKLQIFAQNIMPISKVHTDLPVRKELLIRFFENGIPISPLETLLITDQYNFTQKIDMWVIKKLSEYITHEKIPHKYLNINLSAQSVVSHGVLDQLLSLLRVCDDTGHHICVELTESSLVKNIDFAKKFITKIKNNGASVALDDFGSGHASYGILKAIPFDILKIDGSLISAITDTEGNSKQIVASIYELAVSMSMLVIAEKTPNEEALEWLKQIGVHYSQSYLHAYPEVLTSS